MDLTKEAEKMCEGFKKEHPKTFCKYCGLRNYDCSKVMKAKTNDDKKLLEKVVKCYKESK